MESERVASVEPLDVVIGLGGNLGSPQITLRGALAELAQLGQLVGVSSLYRTVPVGGPPQPHFLNAAVRLSFPASAPLLIGRLLQIERATGRERRERWGPRTLDLDILWIRGGRVRQPGLEVPHPRLRERAFALRPLLDVAPDAVDPSDGVAYREVLAELDSTGVEELGREWVGADLMDLCPGMDRPGP